MEKRRVYNKYDAGFGFAYAVLAPEIFGLLFVALCYFICKPFGLSYQDMTSQLWFSMLSVIISPLAFFYVYTKVVRKNRIEWKSATRINFKLNWFNVLVCVFISVICVFGFTNLVGYFDVLIQKTGFVGNYDLPIPLNNVGYLFFYLFFVCLLPAICEELIFRGIIFNGLKEYSKVVAVVGSALLFALMHGGIEQTIYPIIVGIILALVMLKTDNIIYPMIVHFCNNATVVIYSFVENMSGVSSELSFTWYSILISVVMAVLSFVAIYFIISKLLKKSEYKSSIKLEDLTEEVQEEIMEKPKNNLLWIGVACASLFWIIDLLIGFGIM